MEAPVWMAVVTDAQGLWVICWSDADAGEADAQSRERRYVDLPGWPCGRRLEDTAENREVLWALVEAVDIPKMEACVLPQRGAVCDRRLMDFR